MADRGNCIGYAIEQGIQHHALLRQLCFLNNANSFFDMLSSLSALKMSCGIPAASTQTRLSHLRRSGRAAIEIVFFFIDRELGGEDIVVISGQHLAAKLKAGLVEPEGRQRELLFQPRPWPRFLIYPGRTILFIGIAAGAQGIHGSGCCAVCDH